MGTSHLRSIDGRVAVVTGAASGMGRATSRLFASEGARLIVLDRSEALLDVEGALRSAGAEVSGHRVDVGDAAALRAALDAGRERLGPVDILVNNAGVSLPAPIDHDAYDEAWDATIAVNLRAYATTVRHLLPDLRRDGGGRIVNVASTEGLGATAFLSPYTVAKHGVVGLTRSLAVELGPMGVTVNCVCPGPIRTGMTEPIPEDAKARFARRRVPLRRYGEPEEVAHVILSLVLPASSYVTGATVAVDGGLTVQNT